MRAVLFTVAALATSTPAFSQQILECAETISNLNEYAVMHREGFEEYMQARQEAIKEAKEDRGYMSSTWYDIAVRKVESRKLLFENSLRMMRGWFAQARSSRCASEQNLNVLEQEMASLLMQITKAHLMPLPRPQRP